MAARKKAAKKTAKKTAVKSTKKRTPAKRTVAKRKTTKTKARTTAKSTIKKKRTIAKKRTTTAKRTVKKTTARKPSVKATPAKKISVGKKPYSKSEFVRTIAEQTGLSKKEVASFLETIAKVINVHVQKQGPEMFSWPGLFKIQVVRKPATKQRKGINPFTGEPTIFKAKPASRRVKIRPLKQLKDMAA